MADRYPPGYINPVTLRPYDRWCRHCDATFQGDAIEHLLHECPANTERAVIRRKAVEGDI